MIDLDRIVIAAYRRAWRTSRTSGDTDVRLLLRELDSALSGMDDEIRAEIQELLVSCWGRGVGPRRLHYEFARHAMCALLSPLALLASGPQDPDIWMRLPDGVEPLGLDPEEATLTELYLLSYRRLTMSSLMPGMLPPTAPAGTSHPYGFSRPLPPARWMY